MNLRPVQVIFSLVTAIFLIATTAYLLQDKSTTLNNLTDPAKITGPELIHETDNSDAKRVIFYPANPAPGDFLIVESGPFHEEVSIELIFDFPGVISEYYRAGEQIYAIIAISYDTKPGSYNLTAKLNSTREETSGLTAVVNLADKEFSLSSFSMPPDRTAGWTAERLAEDREKVRLARKITEPRPMWLQPFISPLDGRISSEYGAIRIINQNPPRRHNGIDIVADEGTAVIAPNRGVVRLAEFLLSGGNTVIIDHGLGISSTYMHLHTIDVEKGRVIERGELIGTVGMTGFATGPHLHWEVNIDQTPVNPEQLMQNELLWIAPAYVADLFSFKQRPYQHNLIHDRIL